MQRFLITAITAIALGFWWGVLCMSFSIPLLISCPVAFAIGYFIPKRVVAWLYK